MSIPAGFIAIAVIGGLICLAIPIGICVALCMACHRQKQLQSATQPVSYPQSPQVAMPANYSYNPNPTQPGAYPGSPQVAYPQQGGYGPGSPSSPYPHTQVLMPAQQMQHQYPQPTYQQPNYATPQVMMTTSSAQFDGPISRNPR